MMKLCCIFNTPSLYRELIYSRIDQTYDCDWFFEDTESHLKEFDTAILQNVQKLKIHSLGPFYWVFGLVRLLFSSKYSQYLMMGHTRNLSTMVFLIVKNICFRRKKAYLWTHGFYGKESVVEKVWKKTMLSLSDELFIYGDYACRIMCDKYGFRKDKLHSIHNSLNYNAQLSLREQMVLSSVYKDHFGNDNPVLIFIGRLTPVKQLDMILQAVIALKRDGSLYNVVFVGDGPEKESLEYFSLNNGLMQQVWFFGACYDEKKNAEMIYNADLCVAPGNIGLTAIHVLMFGCPAITHNDYHDQMPEFEVVKDGITGTFFKHNDVVSLAQSIKFWFNENGENRDKVRKNCYQVIDSAWNPDYQMKVILNVIQ